MTAPVKMLAHNPPPPSPPDIPAVNDLLATIAELRADLARTLADRQSPEPEEYIALLAAYRGPYSAEAVRQWCKNGLIDAYQIGTHWFLRPSSLAKKLKQKGW
jgi:hypothetical protein